MNEEQYYDEKQAERDAAVNNESRKEGIEAIHNKIKGGVILSLRGRTRAGETVTNLNKQIAEYEVKAAMHKASLWSKTCVVCGVTKLSEDFRVEQSSLGGRTAKCKQCLREEYANKKSV